MPTTRSAATKLDKESCYRAVKSRDRRFDGVFYTAVHTTGIYCRPSCPARTPAYRNVTFHPTAAAAQAAGFRACKRCLPDATPGSPDWDVAADAAGRAMRLIADGVVDREGVDGLARRVGYTPAAPDPAAHRGARRRAARAGPRPARADRAGADRDDRPDLRRRRVRRRLRQRAAVQRHGARGVRRHADRAARAARPAADRPAGTVDHAARRPHAVRRPGAARTSSPPARSPGVEVAGDGWYARTLDLPHGPGTVRLELEDVPSASGETAFVPATFALTDLRDTAAAVERVRRLLDADCDPVAVDDALRRATRSLGPLARRAPGAAGARPRRRRRDRRPRRARPAGQRGRRPHRRRPARRRRTAGRCPSAGPGPAPHLFPDAATLAGLDPTTLPMPRARGRALVGAGRGPRRRAASRWTVAPTATTYAGALLDTARASARGPPTTSRMRALGHPDVFLPTDVGVRNALAGSAQDPTRAADTRRALAAVAFLRPAAPVAHPDAARSDRDQGELTCGP